MQLSIGLFLYIYVCKIEDHVESERVVNRNYDGGGDDSLLQIVAGYVRS